MSSDAELILNKEHRYSMSELFPVFLDTHDEKILQLKPSTYNSELQLSTEERMQKLVKPFRKCNSFESQETEILTPFTPIPRVMIFQNYIPGKTYTAQLLVRNDTNVLKPLQVIYKNTPNFTVIPSVKKSTCLAPGMSLSYRIQFSPDKKQDYTHHIKFSSCEEHFIVPIAAIGPRPMLDFPDKIEMLCTPVKIPISKYFLVKNIGEIEAVFSLSTDSPFTVEPRSGRVQPGGAMKWCVAFQSQTVGDFSKLLTVHYETGETIHIKLFGTAAKANVYLEKKHIVMGDTFMGLKRESSFLIFNKTEHIVNFRWKRLPDPAHDSAEIERLKESFQMVRDLEMKKYMQIKHLCQVDSEAHEIVYERIYNDEIEALKQEELDFKDTNFILLPVSGEIWPDNWIEITVIFVPDKAQNFCTRAYCDILGAEHRIPLTITGVGQGPLLRLNVRRLDIGYIVANAFHSYEIVVTNSGDIPGTIKHMSSSILYGGKIYCEPRKVNLNPDDYKTFIITFHSNTLGHFEEHIKFLIEESHEVLQLMLKGDIIMPVLHFNKKTLNMNDVGIGFPVSCTVAVHNLSPVSVEISLTAKPDGLEQSLTYKDFFDMNTKEILSPCPKEIMLCPSDGILEPENFLNIKVTVTANVAGRRCASLIMRIKDLESQPMSLPVVYTAKIADIQCSTEEIFINHCFINLPYKRDIVLQNASNVPGAFIICSQEVSNDSAIIVSIPRTQGVVKPGGYTKVPVFIMTTALGRQETSVSFLIMGNTLPSVYCRIICEGKGPVISVVPLDLPWNETLLLKPSMKEVQVINDGPIPAGIEATLIKTKSPWSISPTSFMINPDETNVIEVMLYLTDTGNYSDSMEIKVTNSRTITVNLTATGIGTSITIEPPMESLDLGLLYISQKIVKEFVVENKGTRHHQLVWSPNAEMKDNAKAPVEFPEHSVFCIEPCKFDLGAKEQEVLFLKIECSEICQKTEKIYCHGIINYKEKKPGLLVSEITATFIEPALKFSKEKVAFRIDMGPDDTLDILEDSVILSNETDLPIALTLEVEYPFYLSVDNKRLPDQLVYLEKCSSFEIFILFDPAFKNDKYCRAVKSSLVASSTETPFKVSLPLEGEVNFPNVKLSRTCLDFGCIPIGTESYEDVIVQNTSPLLVVYRWYLSYEQDGSCRVEPLQLSVENIDSPTLKPSKMSTSEADDAIIQAECSDDRLWFDQLPDCVRIDHAEGEGSNTELHSPDGCVPPEELTPAEDLVLPQSSSLDFSESTTVENDSSVEIKANSRVLKEILVPPIVCYFEEERDGEVLKKLPKRQVSLNHINQAFEISPSYGQIEPYGEEVVRVFFNGYAYMSLELMAVIDVANGPSECIKIKGEASDISYHLSSTTLDAGNTLFCDICEKKMVISNTGILGFTYSITSPLCESDLRMCEASLERDALSVRPQSGYLERDEIKELIVQYFPGVPGKFRKSFSLQIGFLNPIDILIVGNGVFPQVQLMLPRSLSYYPPPETTYAAITYLSDDWSGQKETLTMTYKSAFSISEEDLRELKNNEWIVISHQDNFPSAVCIDLEVEKVMAYDVAQRINFLMSEVKGKSQKTLPEFHVPPYYLDFGPVIIGEKASQNVVIFNPGPLPVTIALPQNQNELAESGIFMMLDRVLYLAPEGTATLSVLFEPVPDNYSNKVTEVEKVLNLEVSYGPIVPIILHATVTVPFLIASLDFMDFGEVKCGLCKVMHFYLINEGCVPCNWKIEFLPQWNVKKKHKQKIANEEIMPMFYTKQKMGTYEPNQHGLIEVIFEPHSAGVQDSGIVINMEHNPEEIIIKVEGKGIEPIIDINNSFLQFIPVDPYADLITETFTVTNPIDFPVEIFLQDDDRQYDAEDKVLTSLCHFYKDETLYLPIRTPGCKIRNEFQSFYDRIVALISEKISEQKDDDIAALTSVSKIHRSHLTVSSFNDGRYPPPPNTALPADIPLADSLTKASFHSSLPCLEVPMPENDLSSKLRELLSTSEGDIDTALQACIEELRKENSFPMFAEDPIKEAFRHIKGEPDLSNQQSCSACIVFHGASTTDCLYHAHHTGKLIGFTVLNIDHIIMEAAAYGIHPNEVQVREAINTNYDLYEEVIQTNDDVTPENLEGEQQDCFNSLKGKVEMLNNRRKLSPKDKFSKKPGQKPPKQTPRSTASQKSKKRDAFEVVEGILPEIPDEVFTEILNQRFASLKQPFGIIIESLDSVFLCPETTALLAVFKAVGNVKFLHCVILYDSFSRYFERKEEEENRKKEEESDKIKYLEAMTVEEISYLSDDDVILYNKIQLEKRKERLKQQKEERETLKEMRALQELQKKKNMGAAKKPGKGTQKVVPPKSVQIKGKIEADAKPTKPTATSAPSVTSKRHTAVVLTPEQIQLKEMQIKFHSFEERVPQLLRIIENWDRRLGVLCEVEERRSVKVKSIKKEKTSPKSVAQTSNTLADHEGNVLNEEEVLNKQWMGASVWIYNNFDSTDHIQYIGTHLNVTYDLERFQIAVEESKKLKLPELELFTCYHQKKPEKRQTDAGVFLIQPLPFITEVSESLDEIKAIETVSARSVKKRRKSKTATTAMSQGSVQKQEDTPQSHPGPASNTRWLLQPGDSVQFKVQFCPKAVGEYSREFRIGITDWSRVYTVTCNGLCDLPRIDDDPYVMFDKVQQQKPANKIYKCIYFISKGKFDFGAVVASKHKKAIQTKGAIHVSNCSTLPVNVQFSFMDVVPDEADVFSVEPMNMTVEPGGTEILNIFACPHSLGAIEQTLVCSIKDNPVLMFLKIVCYGVKVDFEVDPKNLQFDYMLLFRKESRLLTLKNKTLVPFLWRFVGAEMLENDFEISDTMAIIKPLENQLIEFTYGAKEVQVIARKPLKLEVFEEEGRGDPLCTETIFVSAEAVDAKIDILFAHKSSHVNFGKLKVGHEYELPLNFKNRGKYEISFKIHIEGQPHLPLEDLESVITILPDDGIVPPGDKPCPVKVLCHPRCEIDVKELPLLTCYFLERGSLVSVIPINVTLQSFSSRFIITPMPDIIFAPQLIGTSKILELTIKNVGELDFKYDLRRLKATPSVMSLVVTTGKSSGRDGGGSGGKAATKKQDSKSVKSKSSGKGKRVDMSTLYADCFTLTPCTGVIEPEATAVVSVSFCADVEGKFSEEIVVEVSEPRPLCESSSIVKLYGIACLPAIDLNNAESMFQEHYICETVNDFVCPEKVDEHCLYVKQEHRLIFNNVALGTKLSAAIWFHNPGFVTCDFSARLLPSDDQDDAFHIAPKSFCISPQSMEKLVVTFQPYSLKLTECMLELTVEVPVPNKSLQTLVLLEGEPVIPEIKVILPPNTEDVEIPLTFMQTPVNQSSYRTLKIANIGVISCEVVIEFSENIDNVFNLIPEKETRQLLQNSLPDESIQQSTKLKMYPKQTATFEIYFHPQSKGNFTGKLNVFAVLNPFEVHTINISGEGYVDEITFEGLSSVTAEDTDTPEDMPVKVYYHLDFEFCYPEKSKQMCFKIQNLSGDVYKFEWSPHENVKLSPSAGHLKSGESKDIIASFLSPVPITISKEQLNCTVYKIIWYYPAKCSDNTWDNAQDVVCWAWNGSGSYSSSMTSCHLLTDTLMQMKCVEPAVEPKYDIIDGTKQNLIVLLSAISDYGRITVSVQDINFMDTFLFQTSESKFILKNEGIVPSNFVMEIILTDVNYVRQRSWSSDKNLSLQALHATNTRSVTSVDQLGSQLSCRNNRRTRSSITSVSYKDLEGEMQIPFTVSPKEGSLQPDQEMECCIKFSPCFLFEYKSTLFCRVLNCHPDAEKQSIAIHGSTLVPVCHFQIEESDYLSSGRRIPSLPGPCRIGNDISFVPGAPLNSDTRVIEFKSLISGHPSVRKFDILNPTEFNFHYFWHRLCESVSEKEFPFHCETISGWLASGHKATASFSFFSEEVGTFESFWYFCVPEMEAEIPFLLVGTVTEPCVYFADTSLQFDSTFINVKTSVNTHLVNSEAVPITFKFDSYSVYSDQNLEHVTVKPLSGRILPNSDLLISIRYMPTVAGTMNFRLVCNVSFLKNPLYLTVSGTVYNIHPIITWKTGSRKSELLNMNDVNVIDVEEVVPCRPIKIVFSITNAGKTTLCYHWILDVSIMKQTKLKVTPSEAKGYVTSHLTTECILTVIFKKKNPLIEYPFSLQIVDGPEYKLLLRGASVLPQYSVSFTEYNFGPCLIFNSNIFYYNTTLIFSNEENNSMTLDCSFVNKPYLTVEMNDSIIAPKKQTEIVISFKPLKTIRYEDVIELLINGVHCQKIFITGEGAELRVQLLKAKQKQIDLGLLQVGQTSEKNVSVINQSVTVVPVSFEICKEFQTGVIPKQRKVLTEDKTDFLQVIPHEVIVMKPQEVIDITVTFTAIARTSFQRMIIMKVLDYTEPLCILKGICAGYEFSFNRDHIYFGVVCERSNSDQTFSLRNTGDIGSRFTWQQNTFDENFDVKPITGYSSPGSELIFTVSFHPVEYQQHLRKVILCQIENYQTMELVVSGTCTTLPEPKEVLSFSTTVRTVDKKTIEISNNTCKTWEIYPDFTGEFFSGVEVLSIPPYSKESYNIIYSPQVMTKGDKHMGTALFRLPESGVILYELNGTSQPPSASSVLEIEVPCKTDYTGNITANNWLDKTQRFTVFNELIKPDKYDPIFTMSGAEYIDIPANSTRDYQFHFFVYRECTLTFKVTFINEDTEEYEFHELLIHAVRCGPLGCINMTACVRQSATNHIMLQNPTTNNITYTASCTASDVFFTSPCLVPCNSEVEFSITYMPLFPGECRVNLEVTCTELGLFPYELFLTAIPAQPDKPMNLNCTLGSSVTAHASIENKANVKASFNTEIDNTDFKIDKVITLESGERKDVPIVYEPSSLGTVSAILAITSPVAGNFSFPIIGKCDFPKPQGPFILTPGGSININFKNIFRVTKKFNVTVNLPVFTVKKTGETIPAKKELPIKVTMTAAGKKSMIFPVYGKLVISCDDIELKDIQWTYYLKGVSEP